jgi:branched-chain amino acid transport system ATP-binding protein
MSLLRVERLVVRYGAYAAVAGVSFEVAPGEIVAMIGPNGAGKTSCFNAINGQRRPTAGRVHIAGEDVTGSSPERLFRRGVARTFQVTATVPSMTVRENVQMALASQRGCAWSLWRALRSLFAEEADRLLVAVGMAALAREPCAVLAYGDLKRLELAIALANEPRILLMDEPTAGMAPGERAALMALTSSLAVERGLGILFTEHDMDIVFAHATQVIVLNRGERVASGTPQEIRSDARVREIYLGGGHA